MFKSLISFEKVWGSIFKDYRNFIHFLLKYRYTDNWEREVNENYLPSDAIGYNIGEYLYHVSPKKNLNDIKSNGFTPKDGVTIKGEPFK
ncbi:MAG: hypothetical protein ACO3UU_13830, partial [Minisyncoccia bacterium]